MASQDQQQDLPDRTAPTAAPISDDESDGDANEQPLTMAQSMILTSLPKNASEALENAGNLEQAKVTIRFNAVGSAPVLRQRVFKITSSQKFAMVLSFLRKKLGVEQHQTIFCYVNSIFAPGLDEVVGNLWRCFKTGDELHVAYALMPAFG